MASTLMSLPTSSFLPLNKARLSNKLAKTSIAPCLATFPSRRSRLLTVKAEAGGDGKDTAVDVQVNRGAVEKRPRRLAVDASPFGKATLTYHNFLLVNTIKKAKRNKTALKSW